MIFEQLYFMLAIKPAALRALSHIRPQTFVVFHRKALESRGARLVRRLLEGHDQCRDTFAFYGVGQSAGRMDRLQEALEFTRRIARDRNTECRSRTGDAMDHPDNILKLRHRRVIGKQAPPELLDLGDLSRQCARIVVPQPRDHPP